MEILKLLKEKQIATVAPLFDGIHSSVIYTRQGGSLYCEEKIDELMEEFCIAFGSTLDGRKNAARKALDIRKNPPILISEQYRIAAFEVPDSRKQGPMWILDFNFTLHPVQSSKCNIIFSPDLAFEIPLSKKAINERIAKTFNLIYRFTDIHRVSSNETI